MNASLRTLLAAIVLAGSASVALARTQEVIHTDSVAMDRIARPSLPATTFLLARATTSGTTKPPGAALDGRLGTSPALENASRRLDALVRMAICTGCR